MNREDKIKQLEEERDDYKKDYVFQIKYVNKIAAVRTDADNHRKYLKEQVDSRIERIKKLKEEIIEGFKKEKLEETDKQ